MTERLQKLKNFLKEDPNDDFILFALAQEYQKMDQLNEALEYYIQLQNKNPYYIGTYYHLGKLYEDLNQQETALESYKDGIEKAKERKDLHALAELQNAKTNLELEM